MAGASQNKFAIENNVFYDQVALLHRNLIVSVPANLICALVVFIGLYQTKPTSYLWGWLVAVTFISILRFLGLFAYYHQPKNTSLHLKFFLFGLVLSASLWGLADSILMPSHDIHGQMLVIVVIAGLTAGGIQTLNANMTACLIYVIAIVLPLCLWLFMQHELIYVVLGMAMTTYLGFMVITSIRSYRLLEKTLTLQYENMALVGDLSESNKTIMKSYKLLEQHESDLIHINKLNEMLQTCATLQEAYPIIVFIAKSLFVDFEGAFVMAKKAARDFEIIDQWGKEKNVCPLFSINECWGMRGHKEYLVNNPEVNLTCQHFTKKPASYICYPLIIQKKVSGFLTLYSYEREVITKYHQRLLTSFIEVVQLSLANIMLRERLYEQAVHDALTGLYNRRYLDERLPTELQRVITNNQHLCVAMMDLDNFKLFNDVNGHDAGDEILKVLARILKENFRDEDIACRYGGEEFLIILKNTELTLAYSRLERVREIVKNTTISFEERSLPPLTISAGIAEAPTHGRTAKTIIQAADKALYVAKQSGRNRIVSFNLSQIPS